MREIPRKVVIVAVIAFVCVFNVLRNQNQAHTGLVSFPVVPKPTGNATTDQEIILYTNVTHGNTVNDTQVKISLREEATLKTWKKTAETKTEEKEKKEKKKTIHLAHVWSPYVVWDNKNSGDPFFPLNQAQNVTWTSMWRAKHYYENQNSGNEVSIYCAILWTDLQVLQQHRPPLCHKENTLILHRSTRTEYPNISPGIHYPFIQDILDKASDEMDRFSTSTKGDSKQTDYMIYTNSDIGVVQRFYTSVETEIAKRSHAAFQINRRSIVKEFQREGEEEARLLTSNDVDLIEKSLIGNYTWHPGIDCFVMRKDIVDGIDLGDLFLGHPPWAGVLKSILEDYMTTSYIQYASKSGMTYHLGDDREWAHQGHNITQIQKNLLKPCIYHNFPEDGLWSDHRYQNTINCAKITKGAKEFAVNDAPFPLFLKPHAYERAVNVVHTKKESAKRDNQGGS